MDKIILRKLFLYLLCIYVFTSSRGDPFLFTAARSRAFRQRNTDDTQISRVSPEKGAWCTSLSLPKGTSFTKVSSRAYFLRFLRRVQIFVLHLGHQRSRASRSSPEFSRKVAFERLRRKERTRINDAPFRPRREGTFTG